MPKAAVNSVLPWTVAPHVGLCLTGEEITAAGNKAWDNCVGILAINTGHGAPGDLPAGNYTIRGNAAWHNDAVCPANAEHPQLSGAGISLLGVHDTVAAHNRVNNNQPAAASFIAGGIVVTSSAPFGGANPANDTVRRNTLENNKPADIFWDGTGTGNVFAGNNCDTAVPAGMGFCR